MSCSVKLSMKKNNLGPWIPIRIYMINTVSNVNWEIFARVLFSRNFAYAKFHENKTLELW